MALNSDGLTQLIIDKYSAKMRVAFPEVAKGSTVRMIPKEDGTVEYIEETRKGPMEIDEEQFRPLAQAIAESVIEHLRASAEVSDTDAGKKWRMT